MGLLKGRANKLLFLTGIGLFIKPFVKVGEACKRPQRTQNLHNSEWNGI